MSTAAATELKNRIFGLTEAGFRETALDVFRFQYDQNETYREYCRLLKVEPAEITAIENIPFLPIQFFKTKEIRSGNFEAELYFESSGTTGSVNSRHFVKDKSI